MFLKPEGPIENPENTNILFHLILLIVPILSINLNVTYVTNIHKFKHVQNKDLNNVF